jgi:RimJ/RimL family protein N-acetyltransferase
VANRFPAVEILTARVLLRAYTEADIDGHLSVYDHDLARRWSIAPQPYPRGRARAWCTRTAHEIRSSGEGICWAAEDRATGRFIGLTGLHRTDWSNLVTDISANLAPWALGHGYATEGLRAIAYWVLVDRRFGRLQLTAAVGNRASRLVAAGCGFRQEGVLRNAGWTHSGRVDMVMYGLTPADLRDAPPVGYAVRPAAAVRSR